MNRPKQQGQLDWLCGVYAVVNAFIKCGISNKKSKKLFKEAILALPCEGWPEVLWKGTSFKELRKMIRGCHEEVARTSGILVEYPFLDGPKPKTDQEYHAKCLELVAEDDVKCLILGLKKKNHWVVATSDSDGKRLLHLDSEQSEPVLRNKPKGEATKEIYCRKQLVVFRKAE
jgi:hypothetical protein